MAASLLHLLEREDVVIGSTMIQSNGTAGVTDIYGEGYAEYYGALLDACLAYCDKDGLLTLLLRNARTGAEDQSSAIDLLGNVRGRGFNLKQRTRIDSTLMIAAANPRSFLVRNAALGALDVSIADSALPAEARERIHTVVVAAAADPDFRVRRSAVGMLAEFGGKADFDLIRQAAENDTAVVVSKGKATYPVRDRATRALAKLKHP
jgi:hypothetical protein